MSEVQETILSPVPATIAEPIDLHQKITLLEQNAVAANEKLENLEKELKRRNIENNILRQKLSTLEQEVKDAAEGSSSNGVAGGSGGKNSKKQQKNNNNNKNDDNMLTKAKELLFEKTKVNKQQEQQIQALKLQIASLKDVCNITKDMVELRNAEVKHLQSRFDTIELRMKAEHELKSLTEKKLAISRKLYTDLKVEYDMQTALFRQLQTNYCEKITLMEAEMEFATSQEEKRHQKELRAQALANVNAVNQPSTSSAGQPVENGIEATRAVASTSVATSIDGEIQLTLNPAE